MTKRFPLVAVFGAIALVSCNSGSNNKPVPAPARQAPAPHQQPTTPSAPTAPAPGAAAIGPAWKVTLKTQCAAGAPEQCVANYGFTVAADGTYQLGPGPQGELQTGNIGEDDDYKTVSSVVSGMINSGSLRVQRAETCQTVDAQKDSDTITLVQQDKSQALARASGTDFCFQTATVEEAQSLHDAIHKLADKFYKLPFPDACSDSAAALKALYAPLQTCSTDAECTLVDLNFDPVVAGGGEYVVTNNCTMASPMAVGNASAIAGSQAKLVAAWNQAQESCGDRFYQADCQLTGVQSSDATAVCREHVCQINNSAPSAPNSSSLR